MNNKKPKTRSPIESVAVQRKVSGLDGEFDSADTLPVGNQIRGRRIKKPSPFTKNFIRLLAESGWSHRRAAEVAGVAPSVVSGWTAGSVPNDLVALLKISDALSADFQYLLTGVPSEKIAPERIGEIFDIEDESNLTGIFQIELKRLRLRK